MSQRFLITGGSQGIGRALVAGARAAGAEVVFTGRDARRIDEVAAATGALGVQADVARPDDNERTVETCRSRMGGIDVLVNNAGYGYRAPIGELDVEAMRRLFDTNVFGLVDLTNRVVPLLEAQGGGDIVNIASTAGTRGYAGGTAYAASKFAVRGISQCWQAELRPRDIRVISVCPSEVQTAFFGDRRTENPNKLYAEDIARAVLAALAAERRALWPEITVFATNPWKEPG